MQATQPAAPIPLAAFLPQCEDRWIVRRGTGSVRHETASCTGTGARAGSLRRRFCRFEFVGVRPCRILYIRTVLGLYSTLHAHPRTMLHPVTRMRARDVNIRSRRSSDGGGLRWKPRMRARTRRSTDGLPPAWRWHRSIGQGLESRRRKDSLARVFTRTGP